MSWYFRVLHREPDEIQTGSAAILHKISSDYGYLRRPSARLCCNRYVKVFCLVSIFQNSFWSYFCSPTARLQLWATFVSPQSIENEMPLCSKMSAAFHFRLSNLDEYAHFQLVTQLSFFLDCSRLLILVSGKWSLSLEPIPFVAYFPWRSTKIIVNFEWIVGWACPIYSWWHSFVPAHRVGKYPR
jgi:hypothetical protein